MGRRNGIGRPVVAIALLAMAMAMSHTPAVLAMSDAAPAVQLRWVGARQIRIDWTGVEGSVGYEWSLRACDGTVLRSGTSSPTTLHRQPDGLVRPACYEAWIRVLFQSGVPGATGAARLPAGATTSVPLPSVPPPTPVPPPPTDEGFQHGHVAFVDSPTDLAFLPDGGLLVLSQAGVVSLVRDGEVQDPVVLDLGSRVCSNGERGLLGVEVAPDFSTSRAVFLYYAFNRSGSCPRNSPDAPVNRVSRFVLGTDGIIDPASERVVLDGIPSPQGHDGGELIIGPDGLLYLSVGDGYCDLDDATQCAGRNDNARHPHLPLGKVLRVGLDGSVPEDNPFADEPGARRCAAPTGPEPGDGPCSESWVGGLRNPFRMAMRPGDAALYVNDVGQGHWEEINVAVPGADYGWNTREGACLNGSYVDCPPPPPGLSDPHFAYGHDSGCAAITGATFAPPSWPAPYGGSYLFADYVCGTIFRLDESGPEPVAVPLIEGLGESSAVAMTNGPVGSGDVYFTTYASGGEVRLLRFVGAGNRAPEARLTPSPTTGVAPLLVSFDASASSDPDGDGLRYRWTFGDGETIETEESTVEHTYATDGDYTASVVVEDPAGATSPPVSAVINVGNAAPTPTILTPSPSFRFRVGEVITLTGAGADDEDGPLAGTSLSWEVRRHHNTHEHPYVLATTGDSLSFPAPPPEDLAATTTSWLDVTLTATDSDGAATTVSRRLDAQHVVLTFASDPTGRQVVIDGTSRTTPATITSWAGWTVPVDVVSPQTSGATTHTFTSWADHPTAARTIVTPATATTYTARFTTPGLPAPVVTLRRTGSGKVTITWPLVAGAESYRWRVSTSAGTQVKSGSNAQGRHVVKGLPGGCYQASVRAVAPDGTLGPWGVSKTVTV